MLQATGLYHGTRVVACWAAGLLSTCPTGVRGPTGQLRGLAQEKQSWFEAGCSTKYSTRLSFPTYHAHIQTHAHSHTQGCTMGLPIWPWHCGLIACRVSGVDLTETNKLPPCCPVILEHCSGCVGCFAHRLQGCFLYVESTTCFSLQQGKGHRAPRGGNRLDC